MNAPDDLFEQIEQMRRKEQRLTERVLYVESFLPGFAKENGYVFVPEEDVRAAELLACVVPVAPIDTDGTVATSETP